MLAFTSYIESRNEQSWKQVLLLSSLISQWPTILYGVVSHQLVRYLPYGQGLADKVFQLPLCGICIQSARLSFVVHSLMLSAHNVFDNNLLTPHPHNSSRMIWGQHYVVHIVSPKYDTFVDFIPINIHLWTFNKCKKVFQIKWYKNQKQKKTCKAKKKKRIKALQRTVLVTGLFNLCISNML